VSSRDASRRGERGKIGGAPFALFWFLLDDGSEGLQGFLRVLRFHPYSTIERRASTFATARSNNDYEKGAHPLPGSSCSLDLVLRHLDPTRRTHTQNRPAGVVNRVVVARGMRRTSSSCCIYSASSSSIFYESLLWTRNGEVCEVATDRGAAKLRQSIRTSGTTLEEWSESEWHYVFIVWCNISAYTDAGHIYRHRVLAEGMYRLHEVQPKTRHEDSITLPR
jgi:hypothetical protein